MKAFLEEGKDATRFYDPFTLGCHHALKTSFTEQELRQLFEASKIRTNLKEDPDYRYGHNYARKARKIEELVL